MTKKKKQSVSKTPVKAAPIVNYSSAYQVRDPDSQSVGSISSEGDEDRGWRFRIVLPQANVLWGDGFINIGTDQGLEVEIANNHIISFLGEWGIGSGFLAGGGAGYAYELDLVEEIFRLQLGFTVGYHFWEKSYYDDESGEDDEYDEESMGFIVLRPMFHIGYKYFFVSFGPKMIAGTDIVGGVTVGFLVRV